MEENQNKSCSVSEDAAEEPVEKADEIKQDVFKTLDHFIVEKVVEKVIFRQSFH